MKKTLRTNAGRPVPQTATTAPEPSIRKVLATTDFSAGSRCGVNYAVALGESLKAAVVLLHVIEPPPVLFGEESFVRALEGSEAITLARAKAANVAKHQSNAHVAINSSVRTGKPFYEITTAARERAVDLIVIATHGYTGAKRVLLGSTAERVVRHAPCPVLTVPAGTTAKRIGKTPPFRLKKILVPIDFFMAAVALAVGAIPEGLPAAVTIVLAIGVSRLAKRKTIIRKLPAVETLGSTTVICSDKTGTLTKNQMTVQEVFAGGKLYAVTGAGYEAEGDLRLDRAVVDVPEHPALNECLRAGVLCNESQLVREDGQLKVQGDPTEAALVVVAEKGGLRHAETHRASPRLDTIPFESEHMFRATLHEGHKSRTIYKVGAMERLLPRCTDTLNERGELVALNKATVHRVLDQMAGRGLRVLALARRHVGASHAKLDHSHVANGLTFLGLQGMMDPPRPEAIVSVRQCQRAGIAVKMITGDHLLTAQAIARQIGLKGHTEDGQLAALSGRELESMSDENLPDMAERTAVFARVAPEQKLRLVRALQSRGHVVAMTGDGVNDAPALKQADIGVAMGISGTDVAKGAAAMILTDDNFASIEAAVEEGRGVFDNLTKFIVWIIPTNLGEALMLLSTIFLGLPLPLLPLQLLWINLTDTLLGLSIAFEPKERDVMSRPPRDPKRPLLTFPLIMRTGLVSLIMVTGGLSVFLWELHIEQAGMVAARTAVINLVVLVQILYLFNCRSLHHSIFAIGLFTNRWTIVGSLSMLSAQLVLTYVPVMNRIFHSAPLAAESWLRIVGVAVLAFVVVEFEKWVRFGRGRNDFAIRP